jgi:hypothetical protein
MANSNYRFFFRIFNSLVDSLNMNVAMWKEHKQNSELRSVLGL